jgi:transposase
MLTERQKQVLELTQAGMGAREIGERLGVSRNAIYQQLMKLRAAGALHDGDTATPGLQAHEPTVLDELESFVERCRSRLTRIDEQESEHKQALDALAQERSTISVLMGRMEGVTED